MKPIRMSITGTARTAISLKTTKVTRSKIPTRIMAKKMRGHCQQPGAMKRERK
jgi:hypothetical protein